MNKNRWLFATLLIAGTLTVNRPDAASMWQFFGLKGEIIHSILPMTSASGQEAIMVGTQRGIWWYEYERWVKIFEGSAVYDMELLPDGRILAIAGNGSDTDGVYLGKVIGIAEPGTIYGFTLKVKCPYPTALALGPDITANGGSAEIGCETHFYVGTREGVHHGKICADAVSWLPSLSIPTGALSSICSSVHLFSGDTMVYAGGYSGKLLMRMGLDKSAIVADPIAYLLRGRSELKAMKRSNTTAMVELRSGGQPYLAIATLDSGIQILGRGDDFSSLPSPVSNEPILAMTSYITQEFFNGENYSSLAIATPSGIYTRCLPDESCEWRLMGKPPAVARCLVQQDNAELWAGTDSGLYRNGQPTGIAEPQMSSSSAGISYNLIRKTNGSAVINFHQPFSGTVVLYTLRGEALDRVIVDGENSVRVRTGRGIRLFRIYRGGTVAGSGSIAMW
jgi:hypothetical protein